MRGSLSSGIIGASKELFSMEDNYDDEPVAVRPFGFADIAKATGQSEADCIREFRHRREQLRKRVRPFLEELPRLGSAPSGCLVHVVKDSRFAPYLPCGAFVVVAPNDRGPADGALVLIRQEQRSGRRVVAATDSINMLLSPEPARTKGIRARGPYWEVLHRYPDFELYSPFEGVTTSSILRKIIASRIVGVLRENAETRGA